MDFNGWLLAGVSFCGGWIGRAYWTSSPKVEPEVSVCSCNCQWTGAPVIQEVSGGSNVYIIGFLGSLIVLGAIFSNIALVCRVNLREPSTGAEREISFSVKGKSKGTKGASQGLAITN